MNNTKEILKARREKLHQIYLEHNIPAFREFLIEISDDKPVVKEYLDCTDEKLSGFMYSAKAALMYLGDEWQEARNRLRSMQFQSPIEGSPICATCKYYTEAPAGETAPCMQLGATPADICCPGYVDSNPN